MAHYGKNLDSKTQLVRSCGDPKCIHPLHLRVATSNDLWRDPEIPTTLWRRGSIGAFEVGDRVYGAQEVYNLQTPRPQPDDPSNGLPSVFYYQLSWPAPRGSPLLPSAQAELDRICAIRRCPVKAIRTVLPCGFIRYDLPPGITEIAFTKQPEGHLSLSLMEDEDEAPESAPEAGWALAA